MTLTILITMNALLNFFTMQFMIATVAGKLTEALNYDD